MLDWLKTNAAKHIEAIVIAAVVLLVGRSWLAEHDARLQADATVKSAQVQIDSLKNQQTAVTKQAAQQIIVLQKEAATVKTPTEAATALQADPEVHAALPDLQPVPDAPEKVEVNALDLFKGVNKCEQDAVNVGACTKSLDIQKQIDTDKDTQIKALKKKPGFWHRVKETAITVGIGVAIGYVAHR